MDTHRLPSPLAEVPPPPQPHTHDTGTIPPYPDDPFSFLFGDGYPEDMAQYDLLTEHWAYHISPQVRTRPLAVLSMLRRAHRALGHPRNQSWVRLMKTDRCQESALEYARSVKRPT